ncbi:ABC transporter permease [Halocynthiibacter sp.]|uniref:ABC transporter permease n=1 Tax=Halocynthiibacter sp. TaxID=1979210 RepID=UPI003C5AC5F1
MILREMSARYGRSPGGYVWAVLEPVGIILILAWGFSLLVRAPALGTSFMLFYATGYLPFSVYQSTSGLVSQALQYSRPLLAYPGVTWIDTILARFFLNLLTVSMVTWIILTGIWWFGETKSIVTIEPILLTMVLSAFLGLSIGSLNCFLSGMFPIWRQLWSIFTRPLFLASGIFYTYEILPYEAQSILWFNPLIHITALMRKGFYPTYDPHFMSLTYVTIWILVPMTAGVLFLRKHHRDFLNA